MQHFSSAFAKIIIVFYTMAGICPVIKVLTNENLNF